MIPLTWALWTRLSPQTHVETLTPNMTVFRDRASVEWVKFKWGHKGRALIDLVTLREEKETPELSPA